MENDNLYQKACLISISQPVKSFKSFCPGTLQSKIIERLESPESGDSEIQNSKSMSSFRDWGMPKLY